MALAGGDAPHHNTKADFVGSKPEAIIVTGVRSQ